MQVAQRHLHVIILTIWNLCELRRKRFAGKLTKRRIFLGVWVANVALCSMHRYMLVFLEKYNAERRIVVFCIEMLKTANSFEANLSEHLLAVAPKSAGCYRSTSN